MRKEDSNTAEREKSPSNFVVDHHLLRCSFIVNVTLFSNAYVERFHRTLNQECLRVHLPQTQEQVTELTQTFLHHYN